MLGISAQASWASKVYNGAPIADRFTATESNQQIVLFLDKEGNMAHLNSMTIEADGTDLYFSIVTEGALKAGYDFTGDPVLCCKAGETFFIGGLKVNGIKFSNNTGARYYIQGTRA